MYRKGLLRYNDHLPHVSWAVHVDIERRITLDTDSNVSFDSISSLQPGQPALHEGISQLPRQHLPLMPVHHSFHRHVLPLHEEHELDHLGFGHIFSRLSRVHMYDC
jgi:hypothetical protein